VAQPGGLTLGFATRLVLPGLARQKCGDNCLLRETQQKNNTARIYRFWITADITAGIRNEILLLKIRAIGWSDVCT